MRENHDEAVILHYYGASMGGRNQITLCGIRAVETHLKKLGFLVFFKKPKNLKS